MREAVAFLRFDDRLSTVLGSSADAPRDRAVQWRQLVELLARGAGASDAALLRRALERIDALSGEVPDAVRVAAAKAIAAPSIPSALLTRFVDRLETATPLLTAAALSDADWQVVRERASPSVRELMDALHAPAPAAVPEQPVFQEPMPPPLPAEPSSPLPGRSTRTEAPRLFRWECGPTGEIDWVDGAPRAALIGRSLADDFHQRFAARLPFSEEPLVVAGEGEMAGEWRWSGTPAFFPDTGRFAGYHGSARRGQGGSAEAGELLPAEDPALAGDRLRELIHELRTPLNAIVGFGEIIEGQILGPAHRAYRDRAGEIVRQARRLMAAVDDLDLAAKLQSGRARSGEGSFVPELVAKAAADIRPVLERRAAVLHVRQGDAALRTALQQDLASRLLDRFLQAVVLVAEAGETLILSVEERAGRVLLTLNRPRALTGISEEQLLDPGFSVSGEGGLNTGFALRLVRGLAIVAGGGLEIAPRRLSLQLASI